MEPIAFHGAPAIPGKGEPRARNSLFTHHSVLGVDTDRGSNVAFDNSLQPHLTALDSVIK